MWTYEQATGRILHFGAPVGMGYSGKGKGKNNPAMENVHNVGPIPAGLYSIGEPCDTESHGPYVLRLTPNPNNFMCGRSGFLIHGDSIVNPGMASEGCIILPRALREHIWNSADLELEVV